MSNLIDHAYRELEAIGQIESDPAYAQGIMSMVAVFSTMGHSGASAEICTQMLTRLLRYENLGPLTDDPEDWNLIGEGMGFDDPPTWQCRRNPEAFSRDGGKTYYLLSERHKEDRVILHESAVHTPKPPIELSEPGIDLGGVEDE